MRSPIQPYLRNVLDGIAERRDGALADYIPELAGVDPEPFGVAIAMLDGQTYAAGDADLPFTIQSVAKAFTYALAIRERGLDQVLEHIGIEPSGDAFNRISVDERGRPANPMINAGAIATFALVPGETAAEKFSAVLGFLSACAGRTLTVDESICASEWGAAYRNLGIANILRAGDALAAEPAVAVEGYIRQSSVLVTTRDLAVMGATLASGGVQPVTRERVIDEEIAGHVLSVMTTCGMYDAAGDWVSAVGIPAKSGVGGGIVGASPGRIGLAAFSPRLDRHGNSVRAVAACERLSRDLGLHLMRIPEVGHLAVREAITNTSVENDIGNAAYFRLQGTIDFVAAETVVRRMSSESVSERYVVVDLSEVVEAKAVALLMLSEVLGAFCSEGKYLYVIDPSGIYSADDIDAHGLAGRVQHVASWQEGERVARERTERGLEP
ncbi:glutaminase [Leucobacter tardus]|uniref:Glutaminase n=1 Tax=Leucobacter tardus TaxID=501483 RepID=A0A939QGP6_9MICO|nr:glutaminase A [Leucobacter tardus]MBO2990535.1 glutaminase A [Leucobacter tardus]